MYLDSAPPGNVWGYRYLNHKNCGCYLHLPESWGRAWGDAVDRRVTALKDAKDKGQRRRILKQWPLTAALQYIWSCCSVYKVQTVFIYINYYLVLLRKKTTKKKKRRKKKKRKEEKKKERRRRRRRKNNEEEAPVVILLLYSISTKPPTFFSSSFFKTWFWIYKHSIIDFIDNNSIKLWIERICAIKHFNPSSFLSFLLV